jgi:PIN domain nuclease of toxin-antitoxin system
MKYIIDSCAMIALLKKETGWDIVTNIIDNQDNQCYAHSINLCEVFYEYLKIDGEDSAQKAIEILENLGIIVSSDLDNDIWQQAGRYKANLRRISLADCFCLSLAKRLNGIVVTSDHHEFDAVVLNNLISVQFIR